MEDSLVHMRQRDDGSGVLEELGSTRSEAIVATDFEWEMGNLTPCREPPRRGRRYVVA